jgi:hypothetical protein
MPLAASLHFCHRNVRPVSLESRVVSFWEEMIMEELRSKLDELKERIEQMKERL